MHPVSVVQMVNTCNVCWWHYFSLSLSLYKCCNVDCTAASCTNIQDCALGLPKRVVCIYDTKLLSAILYTTTIIYLAHSRICHSRPQWFLSPHIMPFRSDLLSVLAQQLQSADVLASHRVFMVLFRTLKELSTKRLAVDQKNYAEVISLSRIYLSIDIGTQVCLCSTHWYFSLFNKKIGRLVS